MAVRMQSLLLFYSLAARVSPRSIEPAASEDIWTHVREYAELVLRCAFAAERSIAFQASYAIEILVPSVWMGTHRPVMLRSRT